MRRAAISRVGDYLRVPVGLRPVQDRHRPVELAHDGADGGRAPLPRAKSPATTGRARPAPRSTRLGVSLHGSLAYTGIGHGTDRAVILGLAGETPTTSTPTGPTRRSPRSRRSEARRRRPAIPAYAFDPATDLVLDKKTPLPGHANGMAFSAYDADRPAALEAHLLFDRRRLRRVGGGTAAAEGARSGTSRPSRCPIPSPMPPRCWPWRHESGLSIAEMKRANEEATRRASELDAGPRRDLGRR